MADIMSLYFLIPIAIVITGLAYRLLARKPVPRKMLCCSLQNKVICVTGASSGIGKELSKFCFDHGSKVVMIARRKELLETLKEEMLASCAEKEKRNSDIAVVQADLAKLEEIDDRAKEVLECFGHVHGLINNAGMSCRDSVEKTSVGVYQRVMTLNFFSHIVLTKALLPSMLEQSQQQQQCWIVAISSLQGKISLPFRSCYGASKHACEAFYLSLRAELEAVHSHIAVCVLSPGYVQTEISLNSTTGSGESYGKMDKTIANGMSASECARQTVEAFVSGRKDVCIAPWYHRLVPLARVLFPSLYFSAMAKRAAKEATTSHIAAN